MSIKQDQGKVRIDLVEPNFIVTVAKIMTYGVEEQDYEEGSWKKVPNPINRYYAALMRHILAWRGGETHDPQSRFHHLAHAAANVMILLFFELKSTVLRKEVSNGENTNL
jgi:hypothetical protein